MVGTLIADSEPAQGDKQETKATPNSAAGLWAHVRYAFWLLWLSRVSAAPVQKSLFCLVAALVAMLAPDLTSAQPYPSRPVTMIVPAAPSSPTDRAARILAEGMQESLGQPIVIENSFEAGGSAGVDRVARAIPDGYTVSFGNLLTHVFNGAFYRLQYDLLNDFEPVSLLTFQPTVIYARKDLPAGDLQALIALLKSDPGKLSAGVGLVGSPSHLASILFQKETGTRFKLVPHRGTGPAIQALLSGSLDLMVDGAANWVSFVRSGRVRALAVMARSRLAVAPDIPTVNEAGLSGLYISLWSGLWVPKKTPGDAVQKLNAAVVQAFAKPALRARLVPLSQEIPPREQQTPRALSAHHKAEIDRWWPIIKSANIRPE